MNKLRRLSLIIGVIYLSIIFTSCGDLLTSESKSIGSYNVNNKNFYINISKVGGSTSADFMQVRRVYNDSTFEVVNNIKNRDSIVEFKYYSDTIKLIVRGRQSAEYIKNDTVSFSINNIWTPGRFKIKK